MRKGGFVTGSVGVWERWDEVAICVGMWMVHLYIADATMYESRVDKVALGSVLLVSRYRRSGAVAVTARSTTRAFDNQVL